MTRHHVLRIQLVVLLFCTILIAAQGHGAAAGMMGGLIPPETPEPATVFADPGREFPTAFDWRAKGGVTPVKDQGFVDCYPCWAFCLIAAVESSVAIESGRIFDLSEQQLLDCNQEGYGCGGGWLDGWTILRDYGAVEESCYEYIGRNQLCAHHVCAPVARVTGCGIAGPSNDDIKAAVMDHAPVACGMTVYPDFSFYSGGCYTHEGTEPMNHGVVIVGWDDTACDGNGAWIVKNSFGPEWGEGGYIMMEYDTCRIGAGARYFEVEMTVQPTPTPTPMPSPSPTPDDLMYALIIPDTQMEPGDTFQLIRRCFNPESTPLIADEYIVLGVDQLYYILEVHPYRAFAGGQMDEWMVYDFIWPDVPPAGVNFTLLGCLLEADTFDVIEISDASFSY